MLTFKEYRSYDALGLAKLIADKEVTPEEVLDAALQRCDEVNPKLNAVVHRNDGAAKGRVAADLPEGPFAGAPFLLKDLYAFEEGQPLGNGSRLWDGAVAPMDFTYTARCREAGLVTFGRTNTPELGLVWTTEPEANGPTCNPWDLERSPGGSSGGAAAAVSAGILPMAHATDGGGSIRMPASRCGLFGLKASRGRNPMGPVVGEGWAGLAGSGVVSRSVRDSAAMLDATGYPETGEPYSAPAKERSYLEEVGLTPGPLRIAYHTTDYAGTPLSRDAIEAVETTAGLLRELGHEVEEACPEIDVERMGRAMGVVIAANLHQAVMARYLELERDPDGVGVEHVTWEMVRAAARLSAADYAGAVTTFHMAGRTLGRFFETHDLVMSATMRNPPTPLGEVETGKWDMGDLFEAAQRQMPITPLFNQTGCPAMSVPLHWTTDNLPVGVHFGAAFGREDRLFRLAGQLEEAKPWFDRVPDL